ncbi:hypothetical protein AQUCO_02700201v1 [Aquilegia coerulea]|uniref:Uncharacterized protein n=1 Tax=Aquilegia coerulea TaxID=218851 RepID=A0A2G5D5P7_AQUCA|nr:hypothetical protein AQUCO_02700201v1 [Aquilegia coerulea]
MSSKCISSCVDDARVPVRATYVNLYKWPESDAEFVKWVSSNVPKDGKNWSTTGTSPRVVDSISCRQMYLRSYTFSREETVPEKTKKCFGRVKGKAGHEKRRKVGGGDGDRGGGKKSTGMKRVKQISMAAFCSIFHRLLSCTTSVDVVDY